MEKKNYYRINKNTQKIYDDIESKIPRNMVRDSQQVKINDSFTIPKDGSIRDELNEMEDLPSVCDVSEAEANISGTNSASHSRVAGTVLADLSADGGTTSLSDSSVDGTVLMESSGDGPTLIDSSAEEIAFQNVHEIESSMATDLRKFCIEENISLFSINKLLSIIKKHHPGDNLPRDARTLLNKKESFKIYNIGDGDFVYFGIKENLCNILSKHCPKKITVLDLMFNIDGVPLFKSSQKSFWPILCCSNNIPNNKPFVIGIYCGIGKPNINIYMKEFVEELADLLVSGFIYNDILYSITIHSFICDAPARAYVKCVKCHGGYYACEKCNVKGIYKNKAISYKGLESENRTKETFQNQSHKEHHIDTSPLASLGLDMISLFPADPMHLLYLGVMKKLLSIWVHKKPYKIAPHSKLLINERLQQIQKWTPMEFRRKPRSLKEFERFKAVEFRSFLLYFGCVILKDILFEDIFKHFLTLCMATRILADADLVKDQSYVEYAEKLLNNFVQRFTQVYPDCNVTYNIHTLMHISKDAVKFGPLDSFSAFKFENLLGILKRRIRSGKNPLSQICNRICEMNSISSFVSTKVERSNDFN